MRIGVDEAGKGDYFGYLVAAAVAVDDAKEKELRKLGVKDSKLLSEAAIKRLAPAIKKLCKHDIVKISPKRYNELYKKFKSLNKFLAWAHARTIENMLSKMNDAADVTIVTDKFAEEKFLKEALMAQGKNAKITQKVRADESDIAVAAASILARYEFVRTLRDLSRAIGYSLPKGSAHVKDAARYLLENYGEGVLNEVAKLHFKITKQISGESSGAKK